MKIFGQLVDIHLRDIYPAEITIANGVIESIEGLEYETGKIIMTKDIYNITTPVGPEIIIEKKLMSDEWYKYVANVKKMSEK